MVEVQGAEPLARVEVLLVGTTFSSLTHTGGRFTITAFPGEYTLNVTTMGYRLVMKPFPLGAAEPKGFEVILSPDRFRQTEKVDVRDHPFEPVRHDSPSQLVRQRCQEPGQRAGGRPAPYKDF